MNGFWKKKDSDKNSANFMGFKIFPEEEQGVRKKSLFENMIQVDTQTKKTDT